MSPTPAIPASQKIVMVLDLTADAAEAVPPLQAEPRIVRKVEVGEPRAARPRLLTVLAVVDAATLTTYVVQHTRWIERSALVDSAACLASILLAATIVTLGRRTDDRVVV